MSVLFGGALALSTLIARRPDRRAVFLTGLVITFALYVWITFPSWQRLQ